MAKKKKFNPQICKIELNPEQAVLFCECYDLGKKAIKTVTTVYTEIMSTKVYPCANVRNKYTPKRSLPPYLLTAIEHADGSGWPNASSS